MDENDNDNNAIIHNDNVAGLQQQPEEAAVVAEIQRLNQLGIYYLYVGDFSGAHTHFVNAIRHIRYWQVLDARRQQEQQHLQQRQEHEMEEHQQHEEKQEDDHDFERDEKEEQRRQELQNDDLLLEDEKEYDEYKQDDDDGEEEEHQQQSWEQQEEASPQGQRDTPPAPILPVEEPPEEQVARQQEILMELGLTPHILAPVVSRGIYDEDEFIDVVIRLYDKAFHPQTSLPPAAPAAAAATRAGQRRRKRRRGRRETGRRGQQQQLLVQQLLGGDGGPIPLNNSSLVRTAAAVIYNTAFAIHLRGIGRVSAAMQGAAVVAAAENQQRLDYQQSLQLYNLGTEIITSILNMLIARPGEPPPTPLLVQEVATCRVLILALYNNMAHLYLHFDLMHSYRRCLLGIRQALVLLPGPPNHEDVFFEINLMIAIENEAPLASSA